LACLAAFASAQTTTAPFTNSSVASTSMSSTASATPSASAAPVTVVPGWNYDGCAAPPSAAGFPGFALIETSAAMTVERCVLDCAASQFAGLSGGNCYCSAAISNGTTFQPDSSCNTPCPGNPAEACGGAFVPTKKRQAAGVVLSLYEKAIVPAGDIYVSVAVTVYVDVNINGFTTVTYTGTVTATGCGCTDSPKPTIPMCAVTTVCSVCGPGGSPSTVTVTVPTAVAASASAAAATVKPAAGGPAGAAGAAAGTGTPGKPAPFTGAASSVQTGFAGLLSVLMAAIALL